MSCCINRISWCDWEGKTEHLDCVTPDYQAVKRLADAIVEQQRPFVLAVHVDGVATFVYAPMDIHQ
jgi:hypothetical protein